MPELIQIENRAIPISSRKMVRFAANVPVEIALQCVDGVRVEGRYGDRVKYTLTDDRTMYVDPFVAERIKELAILPGELFLVCKRQAKKGNRKTIYWVVEQLGDAESQLERDLRRSFEKAQALEPPPNTFYELEASGNGTPTGNHGSNGTGQTPRSPAPPLAKDIPPVLPDTQLAHALKTAIAAAADAEKFATTLDYNVRFSTEDIRSMGITVLIGMQQRTQR